MQKNNHSLKNRGQSFAGAKSQPTYAFHFFMNSQCTVNKFFPPKQVNNDYVLQQC